MESEAFHADLERLRAGEPLAYVIGHISFLNCQIHLDSRPLIPRPETEYWVEKVLPFIKAKGGGVRVLDLCAGSGCIGVAVAKVIPDAQVTFSEIDPAHIHTIQKNIDTNLIKGCEAVQSDLFENVSGKFDFILTNPPYIDPVIDRAEAKVKEYEPHLALYGGVRGMEVIDSIIATAPDYLNQDGQLWIEHEPEQSEAVRQSAEANGFQTATHKDQYGIERCSVVVG